MICSVSFRDLGVRGIELVHHIGPIPRVQWRIPEYLHCSLSQVSVGSDQLCVGEMPRRVCSVCREQR